MKPLRRNQTIWCWWAVVAAWVMGASAFAQDFGSVGLAGDTLGGSAQRVSVSAVVRDRVLTAGEDFVVAVVLEHDEGWHTNPYNAKPPASLPSFRPIGTEVTLAQSSDDRFVVHVDWVQWPRPKRIDWAVVGGVYEVYEGKAVVYVPVSVASDAAVGQATLALNILIQACDDKQCLTPVTLTRSVSLDIVKEKTEVTPATLPSGKVDDAGLFDDYRPRWAEIHAGRGPAELVTFDVFGWSFEIDVSGTGVVTLLLVAAVGGFLLNLTPCVLPVIPIKVMSLSKSAGTPGRTLLLGLVMAVGVVTFWVGLGGAIAFISGFESISELFKKPGFSLGVGLFIAVMAVAMGGLYSLRLPDAVYRVAPRGETLHGAGLMGVMTAVLSTPCTAPLMGAAAAWATLQPWGITMMVFAAIGVGMASPYVVLSAWPGLANRVPRTGPWSELIKQMMGLLLLAAAAYFVGVGVTSMLTDPPQPPSLVYWWVVAAIVTAAGVWGAWRGVKLTRSFTAKTSWLATGLVLTVVAWIGAAGFTDRGPIDWVYYTPERFEEALAEGRPVIMDFTAEWCINCKVLEKTYLYRDGVVDAIERANAVPIKVDLTRSTPEAEAMLKRAGRVAIPLLVVYDAQGREVLKSDAYTDRQVIEALNEAAE